MSVFWIFYLYVYEKKPKQQQHTLHVNIFTRRWHCMHDTSIPYLCIFSSPLIRSIWKKKPFKLYKCIDSAIDIWRPLISSDCVRIWNNNCVYSYVVYKNSIVQILHFAWEFVKRIAMDVLTVIKVFFSFFFYHSYYSI